jgi:hypothetical protein
LKKGLDLTTEALALTVESEPVVVIIVLVLWLNGPAAVEIEVNMPTGSHIAKGPCIRVHHIHEGCV